MKEITRDLSHYLILFGILLASFAGLIIFSYDKNFQISIGLALSVAYVTWGVAHHHFHHDLHLETFIEYLAVAILGFVIIFGVIART